MIPIYHGYYVLNKRPVKQRSQNVRTQLWDSIHWPKWDARSEPLPVLHVHIGSTSNVLRVTCTSMRVPMRLRLRSSVSFRPMNRVPLTTDNTEFWHFDFDFSAYLKYGTYGITGSYRTFMHYVRSFIFKNAYWGHVPLRAQSARSL